MLCADVLTVHTYSAIGVHVTRTSSRICSIADSYDLDPNFRIHMLYDDFSAIWLLRKSRIENSMPR
jgi:hypothetical protein